MASRDGIWTRAGARASIDVLQRRAADIRHRFEGLRAELHGQDETIGALHEACGFDAQALDANIPPEARATWEREVDEAPPPRLDAARPPALRGGVLRA